MRHPALFRLALALLALSACAARPAWLGGDRPDGRVEFERYCAPCHGVEGRGDGPVAKSLRRQPTDLTRLSEENGDLFPEAFIVDVISGHANVDAHGTREMPIWSDRFSPTATGPAAAAALFSRSRTRAVIEHLRSIQRSL